MAEAPTILHVRPQEASQAANTVSWRIRPDSVASGFRECGKYRIRKTAGDNKLVIDDEILESDGGDWVWNPGFYAGQVRAELLGTNDRVLASYLFDVSPSPDKLGRDLFQAMLDRIWRFDPGLVLGTEPAALPVGHDAAISDPWIEYARLRAYGDKFVRALSVISHQPLRELRAERAYLPVPQVRRTDRQTTQAMLGDHRLLKILRSRDDGAARTAATFRFDVPVARETLDAAGNRCIAAITHAVFRRAVRLREALESLANIESESSIRTSLAVRWPRRREFLDQLVRRLRHSQRISPLVDVTRREISAAGLNAVAVDPAYSNAYGSGWRILRHGVEGPPQAEHLWISPTWEIYERWCFVQLGATLQKVVNGIEPGYSWSISRNHKSKATAVFTGSKDGHGNIELLLQPKFPAGDQRSNAGFQSISGAREPDIVLTRTDEHTSKWYVLDAKYRTGRSNVLEAMTSAHVYRDALRWYGRKPECALLLVPRAGGTPWLEQRDFIDRHRVGVYALIQDTDSKRVLDLLLGHAMTR